LKNERGFALIITLLVTALLVALTAEFVNEVYVDTTARQSFVDGQQASLLAETGMTASVALLLQGLGRQDYTSLADFATLGLMIQAAEPRVRVSVEEESGKLNINSIVSSRGEKQANYEIAERLFTKLELSPDLLEAVADWIDNEDTPNTNGAETAYYQGLKPPYGAKNGPLDSLEELRLVKGFDRATVEALRPYLTVYYENSLGGGTAPVNINTAPMKLLASLGKGMTDELAKRIVEYRAITPLHSPTDLGNKIPGMERIAQELGSSSIIMTGDQKGKVFRIVSEATVNETVRVIEAVYRYGQSSYLYWREY
jgi:general secretion pathway protein K